MESNLKDSKEDFMKYKEKKERRKVRNKLILDEEKIKQNFEMYGKDDKLKNKQIFLKEKVDEIENKIFKEDENNNTNDVIKKNELIEKDVQIEINIDRGNKTIIMRMI